MLSPGWCISATARTFRNSCWRGCSRSGRSVFGPLCHGEDVGWVHQVEPLLFFDKVFCVVE